MAFTIARSLPRTTPASFWHLPAHIRTQLYLDATKPRPQAHLNATTRSFSSSRPRQNILVELVTAPPMLVLSSLHSLGLSWAVVIPASAVFFRGVCSYWISKKQHAIAKRRSSLMPLFDATSRLAILQAHSEGLNPRQSVEAREKSVGQRARSHLNRNYGIGPFNRYVAANLATLLMATEAIRAKLGAGHGLIGSVGQSMSTFSGYAMQRIRQEPPEALLDSRRWSLITEAESTGAAQQVSTLAEVAAPSAVTSSDLGSGSADHIPENNEVVEQLVTSVQDPEVALLAAGFDPTTMVEGLSFCQDLAVADPTGQLRTCTLAIMLINLILRPSRASAQSWNQWSRTFGGFDFFMGTVAYSFWLFGDMIPAGIHLYIIASMVTQRLLTIWLHYKDPIPVPIPSCKNVPIMQIRPDPPPPGHERLQ